jgi:hypothetical protein
MDDTAGKGKGQDEDRKVSRTRSRIHAPLPAVLVGLGLLSGAPPASALTIARDDFFSTTPGTGLLNLPVLANDTIPNVIPGFFFYKVGTPPPKALGNVFANSGRIDYYPPPGFTGIDRFSYCVGNNIENACALVSIAVQAPYVTAEPIPALGALPLAGLSGALAWLGIRRRRRT